MANNKTKASLACAIHALTYTLVFVFLGASWQALAIIGSTHFLIDRYRLARYICWAKNWLGVPIVDTWTCSLTGCPAKTREIAWKSLNRTWLECKATGYDPDKPQWMSVWLMIIVDNILHIILNGIALKYI